MKRVSATPTTLRSAIEHGQRVLLETQRPDGSWDERSDVGPMSTAMVLIALHSRCQPGKPSPQGLGHFMMWPLSAFFQMRADCAATAAMFSVAAVLTGRNVRFSVS